MDQITDNRKEYCVAVGFVGPQEGLVTVFARDAEHAKEIVREQFKNRGELTIADVFEMTTEVPSTTAPDALIN